MPRLELTTWIGWPNTQNGLWWQRPPRWAFGSPLLSACRYESEPFWCNRDGFRTSSPNGFLTKMDLRNFASRSNNHAAIVAPVHLPFGQIGVVSFSPRDLNFDDLSAEFAAHGDMLGLYSHAFISSYVSTVAQQHKLPVDTHLTKREVECLHWAGVGKTNDEITTILSLSQSTVRFHIAKAGKKLDAVNRGQAILKAAQLGYLKLSR